MAENEFGYSSANDGKERHLNRIPPHDEDAERIVLACVLRDDDDEGERVAIERLVADDFYNSSNRVIFKAMRELYDSGRHIEYITLKNYLDNHGLLESVGGQSYIAHLAGTFTTSAQLGYSVDIVEQKAVLRRLLRASGEINDACFAAMDSVDDVVALAEQRIADISQKRTNVDFIHINEVLGEVIENIEKASRSTGNITGIRTGFADFDRITGGLQDSDLILVAARPSMGKTAFALNIAQYAAVYEKVPTAIFSLEMSAEQLGHRLLCSMAKVDSKKVSTGNLNMDEWRQLIEGVGIMSEAPMFIDSSVGITPSEMRAKCRKLKTEKNLGLIVIDYLQLMNSGSGRRNDSVQNEVAFISKSLKAIARELDVPVIALAQLSRGPEGRTDHRPMLSDLRDSGAIEQDADIVCFLYRDEYYTKEQCEVKGQAEVIIAKHRNGPTGTVHLAWLGQYTQFANLERHINIQEQDDKTNDSVFDD